MRRSMLAVTLSMTCWAAMATQLQPEVVYAPVGAKLDTNCFLGWCYTTKSNTYRIINQTPIMPILPAPVQQSEVSCEDEGVMAIIVVRRIRKHMPIKRLIALVDNSDYSQSDKNKLKSVVELTYAMTQDIANRSPANRLSPGQYGMLFQHVCETRQY